jgi:hypothetical protein
MMGSEGTCSPFRYEINYRNYFILTQGSAVVKMAPPHSIKYLYPNYDYENFEFRSPVNPWTPQPKYSADFDKIKCLEFLLLPGKTLFLPAFWWYSIKFKSNTSISCFRYRTYMNNLAIIPYIGLHALQIQNVKRNVAKKVTKIISDNRTHYESDSSDSVDSTDSEDNATLMSVNTNKTAAQHVSVIDNITVKETPILSSNTSSGIIESSTTPI